MELPALVTAVALLEYIFFTMRVGFTRGKYNVSAPATSGHPEWERYFRVQQNTLEQLIVFIPSLWMFATFVSAPIGAAIGMVFVIGRAIFYVSYVKDPQTRELGFVSGFFANMVLLIGSISGIVYRLM